MRDLAAGAVFAGYRIEGLAGRGGMGVVYRAVDPVLGRTVALKVIAPWLLEDDGSRRRFLRESRAAAAIEHPNVIPIYAAGAEGDRAYIVMRFVFGPDLRELVRRDGALAPRRAARIVDQVASALDAAHRTGLVHRDVKPANILLDGDEHAYLTDFGLARDMRASTTSGPTGPGEVVGTCDYVAPEQIRGEPLDARADTYALGAVLYHVLTGGPPFGGRPREATLFAHLTERPPSLGPDLPATLDHVVSRALAKRPAERYPSAGDVGRAAVAAATGTRVRERERAVWKGEAANAASSGTASALRPPTALRRAVVAAVALVAIAVVAVLAATRGGPEPPAAARGPTVTAIPMPGRPNGIAAAGEKVWVLAGRHTRLVAITPDTGQAHTVAKLPYGGRDLAAAGNALYAVFDDPPRVIRLDAATGAQRARSAVFAGPTRRIAVGAGAVWVTERSADDAQPSHLLKLDPVTLATVFRAPMRHGARDVTTGGGSVWVASRGVPEVVRVDPETGAVIRGMAAGTGPQELAYGLGAVWSANDDDTVTRTGARSHEKVTFRVPGKPAGIAIHGQDVWVSALAANTLVHIGADNRVDARPVTVGVNPSLLTLTPHSAWIVCSGDRSVTHVRF